MATLYDFSNSDNWSLGWTGVKRAPDAPNDSLNRYYPISDFAIPVQFSSSVLAVFLESETDPGRWIRGGFAKQKIVTGITGGGTPDAFSEAKPLRLREINLIQFQQLSTDYAVVLSIPYWLRHIDVSVYEYTGTITDTLEQKLIDCCEDLDADIAQVRQDLALSTTTILNAIAGIEPGESETERTIRVQREQISIAYFSGLL